ncbi:MAG TPA: serine/threonine protein kinase, partial [Sorangium sp.]|nr:serine/threonine protein kinase [Sorangium sp.]
KTIDKYRIDGFAGAGGFSVVYRGEHTIWKEPVAVKFFRVMGQAPKHVRNILLDDFVREGKLMSQLSSRSPTIVQARDVGRYRLGDDWIAFMVLEWIEGETLDDLLTREAKQRRPPRALIDIVNFLQPVAEAVAVAHDADIAHRDLKPGNIMLLSDNTGIKVLDFGIAKVMEREQLQVQLQHTNRVLNPFSPAYGAPEQFSRTNGATGPWTDVFAMALIVVEMMQNSPVLHGTLFDTAEMSCNTASRPTPRELGMDVSDEVEAVFVKALAVAVADRYRTMRDFWTALEEATLAAAPAFGMTMPRSPVVSEAPPPWVAASLSKGRIQRRWLVPVMAVGALVLGGVAALGFMRPAAPRQHHVPPTTAAAATAPRQHHVPPTTAAAAATAVVSDAADPTPAAISTAAAIVQLPNIVLVSTTAAPAATQRAPRAAAPTAQRRPSRRRPAPPPHPPSSPDATASAPLPAASAAVAAVAPATASSRPAPPPATPPPPPGESDPFDPSGFGSRD